MKLAFCEQIKSIDRDASEKYGIPGILLMENAALSVFQVCKKLECYKPKKAVVFCGGGNNGGDGFAIARHMANDGADVTIVLACRPEKIKGDAKINYDICVKMQIPIIADFPQNLETVEKIVRESPLIIDALLGIGAEGELRGSVREAVSLINGSGGFVVSVDCPTGGSADSGKIMGDCVRANVTVTLSLMKPGLIMYPLAEYAGKVELGGIGAPGAIYDSLETGLFALDLEYAAALMPKRFMRSHKGVYGKAVVVAGGRGMAGAAALCAKAAYRVGCGYVEILAPEGVAEAIQQLAPQAVITPLKEHKGFVAQTSAKKALERINRGTVCLIGPGLGVTDETRSFVKQIIEKAQKTLIIDADALNVISNMPEILTKASCPPVITPHPLEMSRLSGIAVKDILENMLETARDFSSRYNTITVLKDATTIISDNNASYLNNGACSALAKAGSGDILAGITAGLAAQGLGGLEGAALGVFLHSESGAAAEKKLGSYSVLCEDILENIHEVTKLLKND